jgi:hypothetical protein
MSFENYMKGVQLANQEHAAKLQQQSDAETHKLNVQKIKLDLDTAKLQQALHQREIQGLTPAVPEMASPQGPSDIQSLLMQQKGIPVPPNIGPVLPPPQDITAELSTGNVTVPGWNQQMRLSEQDRAAAAALQQKIAEAGGVAGAQAAAKAPFDVQALGPNGAILGAGTRNPQLLGGESVKPTFPKITSNTATGGLETIEDPVTKQTYGAYNIDQAPAGIQGLWKGILSQQEEQRRLKAAEELRKEGMSAAHQSANINNQMNLIDYRTAKKAVASADDIYQKSLSRMMTMDKASAEAKQGNQQAMLALLTSHIGMTLGAQKGARITQAVFDEAVASAPWLATKQARFDKNGYLSGVVLTPTQIDQMVTLGHDQVDTNLQDKQRIEAEYHDDLMRGGARPSTAGPSVSGTVTIVKPDGTRGTIPRENLAAAIKLGAKEVK